MSNLAFVQRQNRDSTTDLICLGCFLTVAHSREQADLVAAESEHICNPFSDPLLFQSGSVQGYLAQGRTVTPLTRIIQHESFFYRFSSLIHL
jgi:hypothetical protein